MSIQPKVTLFVYSYNHEKFISQAVEGAFSQTFAPLEIVLSDDCSTDKTWEIMRTMAEKYTGPHRIILNRNDRNQGITDHLNRIMKLGNGEWFVLAAGDDISLPDRVQMICNAVKKFPNAYGIATGLFTIDEKGYEIGERSFDMKHPYVTGASAAWHRKCFEFFGEITHKTTAEDIVIPFRSLLLGEMLLIKTPTVRYRYHEKSISSPLNQDLLQAWKHLEKIRNQLIHACKQRLLDLEKAKGLLPPGVFEGLEIRHKRLIQGFEEDIENIRLRCRVWESGLASRLVYLLKTGKTLPRKHRSFYYRLKTIIASFKCTQEIIKEKRERKRDEVLKQVEPVRLIKAEDLLNPEIGLLIYL